MANRVLRVDAGIALLLGALAAIGCGNGTTSGPTSDAAATAGTGGGRPSGSSGSGGGGGLVEGKQTEAGSNVSVTGSAAQVEELARVQQQLAEVAELDAQGFAERYPTSFESVAGYDVSDTSSASKIGGLAKIQASRLKLDDAELTALGTRGFAILDRQRFPSFGYGFHQIYAEHLPVYISADSILNALHRSYENILQTLESDLLTTELDTLLAGMHARLSRGVVGADEATVADCDLFLAVARSLLLGEVVGPQAGASKAEVEKLVGLATAGSGIADVELFGVSRTNEDFSQFTPRGHYTNSEELKRYFRAMIWLGRVDLRLIETQPDATQIFRRHQLEIALVLRQLIGTELRPHFDRVDRTIAAFVGEPDYMVLSEVDSLMKDLNIEAVDGLSRYSDTELAQAVIDGNYGAQRISSHIMIHGSNVEAPLPLSRSFALLGQRYAVDSHVFSNVVYDRVVGRMLPNPLDAAFAALHNDQAGTLLKPELEKFSKGTQLTSSYPSALAKARTLTDDHPSSFWNGSLYTLWLDSLRQLSPSASSSAADRSTLFPVARSEAWGRRLLNTQLASWAELRHDTILYVKESYTGGPACEFPDGYVDPYPAFFKAISAYGARGAALLDALDLGATPPQLVGTIREHFAQVSGVADMLASIAENERTGAELTPQMLAFINDTVEVLSGCVPGGDLQSGWYRKLFWQVAGSADRDPTIADVHTQPMDESGSVVGNVLHVGTGDPRMMAVIADNCSGPRAYLGLTSAYYETVTEDFKRLTDEEWSLRVTGSPSAPWMQDLITQ